MPTNKLSDHQCRSAKPGPSARKIFDGQGLYLFVSPSGAKVWRMAYRDDAGSQQTKVFGPYPTLTLADAREEREKFKRLLLKGENPKARKKNAKLFADAVREHWQGRKDVTDGYRDNAIRGIEMHLVPKLGQRGIDTITKDDLLEHLNVMDAAGKTVYVRKVRMWTSAVFEWAKAQGHCSDNPADLINPKKAFSRKKVRPHAALKLGEVPAFLQRLTMEGDLQSALACWMLAYTWVRTGEMRLMRWEEIDDDLWCIPEGKMKRQKDHLVPLSTQALAILEKMKQRSRGSPYVFESPNRADRPLSENAVLYLLARIGYEGAMTGHGWRSIGSTWANEHGYNPDAIERQLAHTPDDKVRSAYNRAEYLAVRRKMLQDWSDWLDKANSGVTKG